MDIKFQVVKDKLICLKYNHNSQVLLAIMDNQVPFQERFLCHKCLQFNQNVVNKIMPIESALTLIKEQMTIRNQVQDEQIENYLNIIKVYQKEMNEHKSTILTLFNEETRIINKWIYNLENLKQKVDLTSLLKQFEQFNFDIQKKSFEKNYIKQINWVYFCKLEQIYNKIVHFQKSVKDSYTSLQSSLQLEKFFRIQDIVQKNEPFKQKLFQVQLIQCVTQNDAARAISFNNKGTIMVASCDQLIKIWKFNDGRIYEIQTLQGHTNLVLFILFSKKLNWFASGSVDSSIRCWREGTTNQWASNQPQFQHSDDILCLIMNQNEDQLISSSRDKTIIVWKIDCLKNHLEYDYTLENKHTNHIYSISMNESETALISCSNDKQIILWKKDLNDKWIYLHHILNDDFGKRISFIDNNLVIWQQYSKGTTHIFQIENNELIRKPELNIELDNETRDNWLYPILVNKNKQSDCGVELVYEPIDCTDDCHYGTLTNDGEHLVIWNYKSKEFRVLRLLYK